MGEEARFGSRRGPSPGHRRAGSAHHIDQELTRRSERDGFEALARLWAQEANLPTPAEIDAPGLWLARIDLPTDDD